jgi:hypothetical protein
MRRNGRSIWLLRALWCFAWTLALAASAQAQGAAAAQPSGWKAVLIAGSDQEPAFDNAIDALAEKLAAFAVAPKDITILKDSGEGAVQPTEANLAAAFAELAPGPDDGCFVYATSHGMRGRGLVLRNERMVLDPAMLGRLLDHSCGTRPTVVVASGCYSGIYALSPFLAAPNRVILTAARPDRPSFGCNANLRYTVFDQCMLASLGRGMEWSAVMAKARTCVSGNEWDMQVRDPSDPQLSVGAAETSLLAFAR